MDAFIVAVATSKFGHFPDMTPRQMTADIYRAVHKDAGSELDGRIDAIYFGSCFLDHWGQSITRGQACLHPLIRSGEVPARAPIYNVEGACATGSIAFRSAVLDVVSGLSDFALAMGVEKLFDPVNRADLVAKFEGGTAPFDKAEIRADYAEAAAQIGASFSPVGPYTFPMATYAVQAQYHIQKYGLTQEDLALCAAKNYGHAVSNPVAYHQRALSVEQVLADKPVVHPFTRSMCSPMTDGAAAVIVCNGNGLAALSDALRARAVRVAAIGSAGGRFRTLGEPTLTQTAAHRAYDQAGLGPRDMDLVELHDATAFAEIMQTEMLGFSEPGGGKELLRAGQTRLGGSLPVNVSGGLLGRGHPIAATGLAMIGEVASHLRNEAGSRQVQGARHGLVENGGGLLGLEESIALVTILEGQS